MSKNTSSRRGALKKLGTAGFIGGVWSTPIVQSVVLPAHAATSFTLSGNFSLNGGQEVPGPGSTTESGSGSFTLNGTTLTVNVTHNVADATAAHIHDGAAGVAGPVAFAFPSPASPMSLTVELSAAQITTLQANGFYVNIHNPAFAPGAIRGQITA